MERAPVLIIGYNRLDLIKEQIEFCVSHNRRVIISIDGPRDSNDLGAINTGNYVRLLEAKEPNWLFGVEVREQNLGCRFGVPASISSAFEYSDSLIILEDDIVCQPLFFDYMDIALEEFRFNTEIFAINTWNPLPRRPSEYGNVFLSRHFSPWGWGTWKDRWANYDVDMSSFDRGESVRALATLRTYKLNYLYERLLKRKLIQCYEGYNTWDYQLMYAMWRIGAKVVNSVPRLSGNQGFDERATHTKQALSHIDAEIYENLWFEDSVQNLSSLSILNAEESKSLDYAIDRILLNFDTKSKASYLQWAYRNLKKIVCNLSSNR